MKATIRFEGWDKNNTRQDLSNDWIECNFKTRQPAFYRELMEGERGETYDLPEGDTRKVAVGSIQFPMDSPPIKYPQGSVDGCVICSLASALWAINDQMAAKYVVSFLSASLEQPGRRRILYATMVLRGDFRHKGEQRLGYSVVRHYSPGDRLDILYDISNCLTLCKLTSTHCVTTWRRWIFDSNLDHALPLERRWLDWCCGSDDPQSTNRDCDKYDKVIEAYRFQPPLRVLRDMPH